MNLEIPLTKTEQRLAEFIAKQRQAAGRRRVNRQIGPQDADAIDLEGAATELLICRVLNVYPDLEPGITPDADAITHDGSSVDIKSTQHKNGRLLVARWKKEKSVDLYILVIGTFPTYRIAGMAPSAEVFDSSRLIDLGRGPSYAVPQTELHSINQLLDRRQRGH